MSSHMQGLKLVGGICVNPLSPKSDQHQISSCDINAYSTLEVVRIKDVITPGEFS